MQNELSRAKLAEHQPKVVITPRIDDVGMFDFYKIRKSIKSGETAARRHIKHIKRLAKVK